MKIKEQIISVKNYVTKSNLPDCDFVINPYVGCPHACKYCYACFMKRFTNHAEKWGTFIDIKTCPNPVNTAKLKNSRVFLSSVTDCYNPLEEKYHITRDILRQLAAADCEITISTKSALILRDVELLKQLKNLKVAVSINTLDEGFKNSMDRASPISERLEALETLYKNGIYTVLFMSPVFPGITDFKEIISASKDFVREYWFENLNLRGSYKSTVMSYIAGTRPELLPLYREIYFHGSSLYWEKLSDEIEQYCREHSVTFTNYFHHKKLVEEKKRKERLI